MKTKYSVGDKVKVIKNVGDSSYDNYVGKIATIIKVDSDDDDIPYCLDLPPNKGEKAPWWYEEELQKVPRGRPRKKEAVKYVASPRYVFKSKEELKKWIEGVDQSEEFWNSEEIFEIKKRIKIKTTLKTTYRLEER